jgi:hypothetical protein
MERMERAVVVLGLTGLACAVWFGAWPSAQTSGRCASSGSTGAQGGSQTSHAYFAALVGRPDCMAAYSLRDNAQLEQFKNSKKRPQRVSYDPANDPDPRRQDAAKIVVPAGKASIGNTIRLPIGTSDGTTTLVTWDAWFGTEFRYENTGIGTYKTFQFASPANRIWFEVRTRFKQDEARKAGRAVRVPKARRGAVADSNQDTASGDQATGAPAAQGAAQKRAPAPPSPVPSASGSSRGDRVDIGAVDARGYGARGTTLGPNVLRGAPLSPQAGTFTVRAETWTRYWVLIEQRANDWDLMSLWVGDEDNDPVQIIDRLQFNVKGTVDSFWLEYNTSTKPREGLGERIGYARNVVMLRNVKDVPSLLQRPAKQGR